MRISGRPKNGAGAGTVPDAHDPSKHHAPSMLTTDLSLRFDPAYEKISRRFYEHPDQFADAFARAWFKLTHRDMGPISRYLGPLVPKEHLAVARPCSRRGSQIGRGEGHCCSEGQDPRIRTVDLAIGHDGLGIGGIVPRLRQARRSERGAHSPCAAKRLGSEPARGIGEGSQEAGGDPKGVQRLRSRTGAKGKRRVSLADLIVLGGCAAVEEAAKKAGHNVKVPFTPGRTDASQKQTDVHSFAVMEHEADGFRNYLRSGQRLSAEEWLVDRAQLLTLTAPEMTVLVGGMRALNANFGQSKHGVFTQRPETLTNDFFVNLLDMNTKWEPSSTSEGVYEGRDRATGEIKWTGTRVDLVFGSNSQLRALAEVYACEDAKGVCKRLRGGVEQGHEP